MCFCVIFRPSGSNDASETSRIAALCRSIKDLRSVALVGEVSLGPRASRDVEIKRFCDEGSRLQSSWFQ